MSKYKRKYKRKTKAVEANQWFKNNDHPLDQPGQWATQEGQVVRYYRNPDIPDHVICNKCDYAMHDHGWIDNGKHTVCPGDFIVTKKNGGYYPMRPGIFHLLFESV